MNPSVAIIIVNWNSYGDTSRCLDSLELIDYSNFRIVVTDNGSEDGSGKELKSNYPEIILLENEKNLGFTGGNNAGIQFALENGFDYLMLLNNDTIVTKSFLSSLIASIESDSKIGAIQPKIMFNQDRGVIWNAGGKFNAFFTKTSTIGENEIDRGQFDTLRETDWITGCCFLLSARVIRQIGLLDQRFFIYHEDADWSLKIRKLSLKMFYEPKSVIYHETGMSDKNRETHGEGNISPFAHYMNIRNHLFLVRRHAKGINYLGSMIFQVYKFFGYSIYFLVRGRFVKLRYSIRGFRDGLIK